MRTLKWNNYTAFKRKYLFHPCLVEFKLISKCLLQHENKSTGLRYIITLIGQLNRQKKKKNNNYNNCIDVVFLYIMTNELYLYTHIPGPYTCPQSCRRTSSHPPVCNNSKSSRWTFYLTSSGDNFQKIIIIIKSSKKTTIYVILWEALE